MPISRLHCDGFLRRSCPCRNDRLCGGPRPQCPFWPGLPQRLLPSQTRHRGDGVRPSCPAPLLLRWPLPGVAVLLVTLMAASALAWAGGIPASADGWEESSLVTAQP